MVTDAIMSAVQGMVDQFDTPEKKEAGEQIYNMLAEFDEDKWSALVDPGEVTEWLRQFIGKEDHSSDHVFTVYKKAATFEKKYLLFLPRKKRYNSAKTTTGS